MAGVSTQDLPPQRLVSYTRAGLAFDVLDEGPIDGPVVVLLHGFPQLNTSWGKVAPLLHAQGFRTLAPNQRGYSPGARPKGRRPYRMAELAEDVVALIRQVGAPVHLVGHDWGAAVAWALAMTRPDDVRTLTTVSVPHPGAFLATMRQGQALHSWYMAFFNLPLVPEWVMGDRGRAWQVMRRGGMSRELFETFWRDFGDGLALRGGLGWYRALAFGNPREFGQSVHVPTTHVWSGRDGFLIRAGAELTAQYVEAPYALETLEGVSHWIPDEAPEDLSRIILERIG